MGHLTLELVSLGESYSQIQRRLGCSKTSLHRWAQIVQAFPSPDDCMLQGQPACMSVLNACVTSARQIEGLASKRWIPAAKEALGLVERMKTIPSVRKLTAALARRRQARLAKSDAKAHCRLAGTVEHSVHNRDCVEVAKELQNASVDLAWLDPCYLRDDGKGDAQFVRPSSPLVLTGAANPTADESRAVLRLLVPILSKAQADRRDRVLADGRTHADPEMVSLFLKHGWRLRSGVTLAWASGSGPARSMKTADAPDGERYLVWARANHVPTIYDSAIGRHGIVEAEASRVRNDFRSEQFDFSPDGLIDGSGLKHRGRRHLMEKPVALAERFFRKYLPPRSMVFDCFGCSGSACLAAANLGHQFIYAELDPQNFRYGAARIADHLDGLRKR